MDKNNIKLNIADIEVLQTIEKRKSILNFTEQERSTVSKWADFFAADIKEKSPFFRAENGDWRAAEKTKVPIIEIEDKNADFQSVSTDIKNQNIPRGVFKNTDTDWNIQVSRRGLEDTLTYGRKHKDPTTYNILYKIAELIQNSVLLDSVVVDKNNNNKGFNSAFMHKFYGLCVLNKNPCLVKLSIEEMLDGKQGTIKRLYNLQDIKMESLRHATFTDKQLAFSVLNNSEISVSELFSIVKEYDKDFYLNKQTEQLVPLKNKEVHTMEQENTKQETPVKTETDEKSLTDTKAFFDNFVAQQTDNQSIQIAKAKDKISELEAKIEKAKATQKQQNNIADVCKSVIDSKAYPALSPIISAIAKQSEKSANKKDKKIKRSEKKIKKQLKKIKKFERRLKRAGLLKSFISSLKNSDEKQTAFVDGMKALQQDSLISAKDKLEKTVSRLDELNNKLQDTGITETDKIKLGTKIKKMESKRDKLVDKVNNLNELDQSLNKLAKIELIDSKVDELANTTIETAEKSAMKASNLSDVIDDIVRSAPSVIDKVLNEDKEQKKDNSVNLEKADKQPEKENVKQTEKQLMIEHPVRKQVTQQQMKKLIDSGMPLTAVKKDNKLYAVFEKADVEKVNNILAQQQQKRGR